MDCGLDNMARWTAVMELQGQLGRWPTGQQLVNHIQGQNRLSAGSFAATEKMQPWRTAQSWLRYRKDKPHMNPHLHQQQHHHTAPALPSQSTSSDSGGDDAPFGGLYGGSQQQHQQHQHHHHHHQHHQHHQHQVNNVVKDVSGCDDAGTSAFLQTWCGLAFSRLSEIPGLFW